MTSIHEKIESKYLKEPVFELFLHNNLLCCIMRMPWSGNYNGYVAVESGHPLHGKNYDDKVCLAKGPEFNGNYIGLLCASANDDHQLNIYSIDVALKVHGGITYSQKGLSGIDDNVFPDRWWFGFDTSHAGDLKPLQGEIDMRYSSMDVEYRDFEYVKEQVKGLAEQLCQTIKPVTA